MSSAATLEVKNLEAAQRKVADRQQAGILAMRQAIGDEGRLPEDLVDAAAVIYRLKNERNDARRERDEARKKAGEIGQQMIAEKQALATAVASLVEGEPESANPASVDNARNCIQRLRSRADEAEASNKTMIERVRQTFTEMGLAEVPSLIGCFVGRNALVNAAEAGAMFMHGDTIAKQGYLRRRGWIMASGGWQDPLDARGKMPFESAVNIQIKRDVLPFKGLGSRDWKPEVKAAHRSAN